MTDAEKIEAIKVILNADEFTYNMVDKIRNICYPPARTKIVYLSWYTTTDVVYISEHMPKDSSAIAIRKITLTEGEFDLDGSGIVDK